MRTWFCCTLPCAEENRVALHTDLARARAWIATKNDDLRSTMPLYWVSLLNELEDNIRMDVVFENNLMRIQSEGDDGDPYDAAMYVRMLLGLYFPNARVSFRWVSIGDGPVQGGFYVITADSITSYDMETLQQEALDRVLNKMSLADSNEG